MKVLITDPIEQSCIDIFKKNNLIVDHKPEISNQEIVKIISDYDALVVRSGTKITSEIINAANSLKVIGRAGTGVDNIDVQSATRKGIIVMNTPGGNTISTAEHTISMLLSVARNIPQAYENVKSGKWDRKKFRGVEVFGKTLGLVGLGKIGREVALRAKGLSIKIIGYDPLISLLVANELKIELVSLEDLYQRSDFISIHTPLNDETKYLFNSVTLKKCKKGVRIINCARGGIIDEVALLDSINSGHVAAAALDVFEVEPPKNSPLLKNPNIIFTPHLGAATDEAQEKVSIQIAEQICDALLKGNIVGAVNASALEDGIPEDIKAYTILGEKLGSLMEQLSNGKLKEVSVELRGNLLHQNSAILKISVLKGLLSRLISEPINYINAPVIAESLGFLLSEKKDFDTGNFNQLISVYFKTDKEDHIISGTVIGNSQIKLVRVDSFFIEAQLEGTMLYYSNIDKPGILAHVSNVLAKNNINIAGLALGRTGKGEKALTIISVDSHLPQNLLNDLSEFEGIINVKIIEL
ncbi:MAG: phosphoglycerate dehydrogenase [Bacteroidetes bacterium]|nr:phosphoglycerate dehydrogenase [Bacteroidota bacterium]